MGVSACQLTRGSVRLGRAWLQERPFAKEALQTMQKMSPTSLKVLLTSSRAARSLPETKLTRFLVWCGVGFGGAGLGGLCLVLSPVVHLQLTFHQLRQGRKLDFAAGFRMEYRLGQRVLVRARRRHRDGRECETTPCERRRALKNARAVGSVLEHCNR